MTADENVAVMRRAYEAFNTADMDALTEIFDENLVWHLPGRSSMADDYQGRDATFAYFGQLGQETGGTFRAELERLLPDDDDRVVGIQRSTAERNGKRPGCRQLHCLPAQGRTDRRRSGALQRPLRLGRVLVLAGHQPGTRNIEGG